MLQDRQDPRGRVVGRYAIFDEIASGGMAAVYFGRLLGPAGFSRTVAIKRLHSEFAKDPDFVAMLLDEARVAARIRHPNVVSTLDVVFDGGELFLVMDYVEGESLSRIRRASHEKLIPISVVSAILTGILQGLHAAHEATSEGGQPLVLVHRDVSPQNILVGIDGTPRVADFGVAKAAGRVASTRDGQVKGKAGYMAPEQLRGGAIDRRVDVYASAVVLWELLTGQRLFVGDSPAETMLSALEKRVDPPGTLASQVPPELDALVMRGLARDPDARFGTALEMAAALERTVRPATAREVAGWLASIAGDVLRKRAQRVTEIESSPSAILPRTSDGEPPERPVAPRIQEAASQVSSISVATPQGNRAVTHRRAGWIWGITAVSALSVVGALAVMRGQREATTQVAPTPMTSTTATATATSSATPPSVTPADSDPMPSASPPDAGGVKATRMPAPTPAPVRVPPSEPKAKPRKAGANCNPPYTLDPSGIHIAKPECL
jgi:serine/threonine protein kinase